MARSSHQKATKESEVFTALRTDAIAYGFDMAGIGLCISHDRIIAYCNQEFAVMFGYIPTELAGRSLACLYPSISAFKNVGSYGLPVMQHAGRYNDERVMAHRNGTLFWCRVTGRSSNLANPFSSAVWVFEDISVKRPVTVDLSPRERDVVQRLMMGKTSKEIARELTLGVRTIDSYRASIIKKFKVKSVIELVSKVAGLQ